VTGFRFRSEPLQVIVEPPGVARGLDGWLPNGDGFRLYVRCDSLPIRLKDPRWELDEFRPLVVIAVARQPFKQRWRGGWTIVDEPESDGAAHGEETRK
jgi:hypothetical protein